MVVPTPRLGSGNLLRMLMVSMIWVLWKWMAGYHVESTKLPC